MLDDQQLAQFHRDGHLVVSALLDDADIEELRERTLAIANGEVPFPTDRIELEPDAPRPRNPAAPGIDCIRKLNDCAVNDAVFRAHAGHPKILRIIQQLLGPDIKLFGDQLFMKPPGGMEKTYHQDSPYFPIRPMNLVSSWVALDEVTLENGCLWVIPGSHRLGALAHSEVWMVGDREDMCVPDHLFNRELETPVLMQAGDCSFHHSLLLHRSGSNQTPNRRRGLATHYMSAQSTWVSDEPMPTYVQLSGESFPGCV
ncbi:MAG: phytanoyl-CoA dioxygenase family protein [Pseudomonadota bacterium]